jgi:hypothetical protein
VLHGPIPEYPHQAPAADEVKNARSPGAHRRDNLPAPKMPWSASILPALQGFEPLDTVARMD